MADYLKTSAPNLWRDVFLNGMMSEAVGGWLRNMKKLRGWKSSEIMGEKRPREFTTTRTRIDTSSEFMQQEWGRPRTGDYEGLMDGTETGTGTRSYDLPKNTHILGKKKFDRQRFDRNVPSGPPARRKQKKRKYKKPTVKTDSKQKNKT